MSSGRTLKTINQYFEDLAVGDRFVTRARTVTEADLTNFAGLSGDFHQLHTDKEFAKSGPFGALVAHGLLILAIGSGLEATLIDSEESRILGFYGMDRVRFTKPVFIGETLHIEAEVIALADRDDKRGVVTIRQEIKNHRGETAAVFDKKLLYKKRATSES
jgi:3-hydroxybutyryl-CoA dehydratase